MVSIQSPSDIPFLLKLSALSPIPLFPKTFEKPSSVPCSFVDSYIGGKLLLHSGQIVYNNRFVIFSLFKQGHIQINKDETKKKRRNRIGDWERRGYGNKGITTEAVIYLEIKKERKGKEKMEHTLILIHCAKQLV